ncbi:selenium-dependent molybdenum hydroxylase system protein, YqeB family [Clostridium sp. DL-VIII]|uniref:selenium-dependent molybdenum cofactor biosynthesis protein YqeB n=1 Tax=Clostridium sp. DL-VIII TaxID=641107 RepID=UPI00023AF35A|nr:selenium-dependent molybdenum cofactor biosynthesis protein YqeB [Clostridium sp. DL-VIII]EHI97732.1 selenium-dependent molybdenum hydroxylase system protein, YqeB family [Clostridium sp. DL-VIII]
MIILIKGAGDLATGVAHRLKMSGFNVIMTEIKEPTTVRRTVAFSQAVYDKEVEVEGIKAKFAEGLDGVKKTIENGEIPIIIDEKAEIIKELKPNVVIDAIIAKENLGTTIGEAPIVIALGPGFEAGIDCHCVIETQRGHYLGKAIYKGSAIPNTGVPGNIGGYTKERIIRAASDGKIMPVSKIGDYVEKGDIVAYVNQKPIFAQLNGIVRGMLQKGVEVHKGMKSGDIDPRCEKDHCFTISDKARSIGGGVLEAIFHLSSIVKH